MRGYAGTFIGNLLFIMLCSFPVPLVVLVGLTAWQEGESWAWIAITGGLAGSALLVFLARRTTWQELPLFTRRHRLKVTSVSYGERSFVLWAPRPDGDLPTGARLTRADVLEASLVRYSPDGEATFTTHFGNYTPDEFTPLVRLRLRVHGMGADGAEPTDAVEGFEEFEGFEVIGEWRVPSLCLSAVTAGRLAVLVSPADPSTGADADASARNRVVPLWPRSTMLAGTRTCRVVEPDGRTVEVTGRIGRQLRQMRISLDVGGVAMDGDTIDIRRLDPPVAARYAEVAEWARAHPEDRVPVTEPGEEARWLVDELPGERASFGSVGRGWSRRGGVLVRGRFLQMAGTHTFQDHGPVVKAVLRVHPADGTPPFDAARKVTVPMDYLTVLHRTREVVLSASPDGRLFVVDWARSNLLAGTAAATVVSPEGEEFPVTGRPDVIWALMNLLASHGLSNPKPVLDLRKRPLRPVAAEVMAVVRGGRAATGTVADAARA
ncbi:hypothetical protein [Streptomyces sp. NPDC050504]|uniref:hypothetical protein n=1 Tax=Streptomyces sp. NPDC050504 TaxID=3365618 RepID=UPI00379B783C